VAAIRQGANSAPPRRNDRDGGVASGAISLRLTIAAVNMAALPFDQAYRSRCLGVLARAARDRRQDDARDCRLKENVLSLFLTVMSLADTIPRRKARCFARALAHAQAYPFEG